jgi:S1-C subfamily serine protease
VATLITCFADGGQHYQILGVADETAFEQVRSELARMATGFRLDEVDDPMHLDIHTRGGPAPGGSAPAPGTLAGVIASADAAVVTIASVLDGDDRAYGSGTLLREDGVVVTNHHVVRGARRVTVSIPGFGVRRARVVAVDPARDLALLKVPGRSLPSLSLTQRPVRPGDDVIAIGSPMGLAHTVTKGIISSTRRIRDGVDYLQTDVSVNPGNSGGPLLNDAGEVVGINTFILRESEEVALTGLNFAVAAPYVREMAESHGFALEDPPPNDRPGADSP